MARGVDGREIFADDWDRRLFLSVISELRLEMPFTLFAYCLMPNHFHLVIRIGQIPLSRILQRLLTRYVLTFNNRHAHAGHLFQARYKAIVCIDDSYLLRLVSYVHENPVRSGLVVRGDDWRWSSSRAYSQRQVTTLVDPETLPRVLGLGLDRCIPAASTDFDPWPANNVVSSPLRRDVIVDSVPIEEIAATTAASVGLGVDSMRSRRRMPILVRAKRIFIIHSIQKGYTLTAIARWLRCTPAAVHYLASRSGELNTLKA